MWCAQRKTTTNCSTTSCAGLCCTHRNPPTTTNNQQQPASQPGSQPRSTHQLCHGVVLEPLAGRRAGRHLGLLDRNHGCHRLRLFLLAADLPQQRRRGRRLIGQRRLQLAQLLPHCVEGGVGVGQAGDALQQPPPLATQLCALPAQQHPVLRQQLQE